MDVITRHLGEFGDGLLVTVELTLLSLAGALVAGVIVAAMRVSPVAVLRAAGTAYVETLLGDLQHSCRGRRERHVG